MESTDGSALAMGIGPRSVGLPVTGFPQVSSFSNDQFGLFDFSVISSPNKTLFFYSFGFEIGIGDRGTGIGTRA